MILFKDEVIRGNIFGFIFISLDISSSGTDLELINWSTGKIFLKPISKSRIDISYMIAYF